MYDDTDTEMAEGFSNYDLVACITGVLR